MSRQFEVDALDDRVSGHDSAIVAAHNGSVVAGAELQAVAALAQDALEGLDEFELAHWPQSCARPLSSAADVA
jgi:hypothetical protein